RGERDWAICGVSLRRPDVRDALQPQQGLYALIERSDRASDARVIGSVRELLVAPESPQAVIERIAAPSTRWVTLTITEKGYGIDAATGGLDPRAPQHAADLARPGAPASAVGLVVGGLARRFLAARTADPAAAPRGLAVISCDNLSSNGRVLGTLMRDYLARQRDNPAWTAAFAGVDAAALSRWIDAHVRFPSTMVDRIVPATDDALRTQARELLGCEDAWPVAAEPFSQWVLEDDFADGGRPGLERSGVQLVPDVAPYEAMKLRLLNAAHSLIAYLAVPAGFDTVAQAIAEPAIRRVVERFWRDEAVPALPAAVRSEAPAYCAALLPRFANAALAHRTTQIAIDGSQKLPVRIVPTLAENAAAGAPIELAALAIAAWIRFLDGRRDDGARYAIDDPRAAELQALVARFAEPAQRVPAVLALAHRFGSLNDVARVRDTVARHVRGLAAQGVLPYVESLASER
ncbi:MAG TPA: mannitol dehydrogenase family protein, partial [Burkholderiaceae bacterium]|nr:mannitol dehydrogenase family protein [Burkholderiaceae bacterium]